MRVCSFISRIGRAAKLDVKLYQEVKADSKASWQAFLVVVLVSLAISIGIGIAGWFALAGAWSIWGILAVLVSSVIVWLIWASFAYFVGTRVFRRPETSASMGALLRTIGFSSSPGALGVLVFIPMAGGIILLGVSVWALAAGVIAVKQSLAFTTRRAIATCLVSWSACVLTAALTMIPLSSYIIDGTCTCGSSFDNQLNSIVNAYRFSIVRWEIASIPHEWGQWFSISGEDIDNAVDKVVDYFSHEGERDKELGDTVERILESQIKEILVQQDIYGFPPVNLKLGELPHLLVISPRDKIESMREIMLLPGISLEEIEDIEAKVDELGVSSLVVGLGGFGGTYPSFVTNSASLRATINTTVEEWIHQHLAFKPLGFRYLLDILGIARNYEVATMNETVAGIVSKEIGAILYETYYRDKEESVIDHPEDNADESGFDFNQEMREIRIAVDAFLARGEIELAEQYMEQKREYLASQGYHIRKLNQAYFAWYGTYADEPTSVSPIGTELRELRDSSASLKDFLDTVAQMTSRQELKSTVESIR
ncbi:MAG TPA: YIP1 family protein [Dehalococcoidia bacterium]|nr:YIP1 family protein [Dehalococcoidia bacterium]